MAKEKYVPCYNDYLSLKERRAEVQYYYGTAQKLKKKLISGSTEHRKYREALRVASNSVGLHNGTWSGVDAESYQTTAKEICSKLMQAEEDYVSELNKVLKYCDEEAERLRVLIQEVEEDMNIIAKGMHVWEAGVKGNMKG